MATMTKARPQQQAQQSLTLQGQVVPAESVQPDLFFSMTRRKRNTEKSGSFAGNGASDFVEIRKSDIIGALHVRFSGSLVVTHGSGSVASTYRWPYDLLKSVKFTANGQSNLINVSGAKLKVREIMANPALNDRGVAQTIAGSVLRQGSLSMASEAWGVGTGTSAIGAGTYPVELYWRVPVAENDKDLAGAIFAQTSEMDLTVQFDWETIANLFTIVGNDTVALTGTYSVESEKYSIPSVNGLMVIPDLSLFHSLIQTPVRGALAQGENEPRVLGQGAGRTLLRVFHQTWSSGAPLQANATNYGVQGWRYGSNETPETFLDGQSLREWNERLYNNDIGAVFGFLAHEFEATWAFRDSVDQGQTSELRLVINYNTALTTPVLEYVQETMFAAGTAA